MKSDCFNTGHDGQRGHPFTQIASRHARRTHFVQRYRVGSESSGVNICLITESPMRSSEALWGIEMFPKISFGDNLGVLSFERERDRQTDRQRQNLNIPLK